MKRYFQITLGALAMIFVALFSAALTLRIALHGGEVSVPSFAGMSISEASDAALHNHLDLKIDNKFYSTVVPAGRILSQAPAAGSRVRKKWQVRVTVSLGPQQVSIPDVVGQPQRDAAMSIRRMSLDLGAVAHIGAPGDPDIVLAQTPPPNAGVDRPQVSLLLSEASDTATGSYVMPSFVGMSYTAATHAATAIGLRPTYIADTPAPVAPPVPPPAVAGVTPDATATPAPVRPASPSGPVTAQKPEPGYRFSKGDAVRLTFGHGSASQATAAAATP
jgi:eukaryotic-like serine/threonine-protein kinase